MPDRRLAAALCLLGLAYTAGLGQVLAQAPSPPSDAVNSMLGGWEMSNADRDRTCVITFKLDPAAKFHDGSPVTAEAVQYSFQRLTRLAKGNSWMVAGILDQNSVQAVDPLTVKMKLIKAFSAFPQVLPWLWVVNPKDVTTVSSGDQILPTRVSVHCDKSDRTCIESLKTARATGTFFGSILRSCSRLAPAAVAGWSWLWLRMKKLLSIRIRTRGVSAGSARVDIMLWPETVT